MENLTNLTKASAGNRFLAALIDGLIGNIPYFLFKAMSPSMIFLGFIFGIGYQLTKDALPFLNGQSIGKKAMGIKVVMSETGEMITNNYGAAIVRQVSLLIPFFNIIDACMVWSSEGLRFGDQWAKTRVVKA